MNSQKANHDDKLLSFDFKKWARSHPETWVDPFQERFDDPVWYSQAKMRKSTQGGDKGKANRRRNQ